jgi:hypothetical protein
VPAPALIRRLYWAAQALLLTGTLGATVWLSRTGEWHPLTLVVLLLALTLAGEWLTIETHSGVLKPSFYALVLAMSLLGPGPAVAFGVGHELITSARRHLRPAFWLGNLTAYSVVPFACGWIVRAMAGDVHDPRNLHMTHSLTFGLVVFTAMIVALLLIFVLIGLDVRVVEGRSLRAEVRELFSPLLPGELAAGALAAIVAIAYTNLGISALLSSIVMFVIFRHLMVALLRSEERAEKLEASTLQLAGMQWGVLRTLARVVNARDPTTSPHAAAAASYAKALATELGLSQKEQEVVHTAGLLHEVGKFGWPDRILHAAVGSDEDLRVVRSHPQEGAMLVGALHGYAEVAEAILHHHERIDGGGYPAGLIGSEIPLASRILAICSTYDAMTAGRPYRPSIPPEEAIEELRHGAKNGQLDPEIVESLIGLLEREGATFGKDADFESELEFERQVHKLAEPHPEDPVLRSARRDGGRLRAGPRRLRANVTRLRQDVLNKG